MAMPTELGVVGEELNAAAVTERGLCGDRAYALGELYPRGRFEVRRFRPNIVIRTGAGVSPGAETVPDAPRRHAFTQ